MGNFIRINNAASSTNHSTPLDTHQIYWPNTHTSHIVPPRRRFLTMAFSDKSSGHSLIPSYLYTSSSSNNLLFNKLTTTRAAPFSNPTAEQVSPAKSRVMVQAPNEPLGKIEMYSPAFYAACTAGGILSCGLTHMTVTPLDLVKCNMQVYHFVYFYVFI